MPYSKLLSKISKQWLEAQEYFKYKDYKYQSFEELKSINFYNWFFQVLEQEIVSLEVAASELKILYRAVEEQECDYDRFKPKWKYASNNRMNGKDKLYYYFGTNFNNSKDLAKKTCIREIRAKKDNFVTFCKFEVNDRYINNRVISFRKDFRIPLGERELEKYMNRFFVKYGRRGIEMVMAKLIINLIADSSAFEPIDKDKDKEYEHKYIPFWGITDYLESLGYIGILYDSTVCTQGVNVALFDLKYAKSIIGSMESIKI